MKALCKYCFFFRPYDFMDNFGYCVKNNVFVDPNSSEVCSDYRETTINDLIKNIVEKGYVYCATCRRFLTNIKELDEHYNKHIVSYGFIRDEGSPEEIPSVD